MIPTWTVYKGLDGELKAWNPHEEELPPETVASRNARAVGYVTAKKKDDAIDYVKNYLLK
jgi:hypothetical protein